MRRRPKRIDGLPKADAPLALPETPQALSGIEHIEALVFLRLWFAALYRLSVRPRARRERAAPIGGAETPLLAPNAYNRQRGLKTC